MSVQEAERARKVFSQPVQANDGLRHYLEVVVPSRAQVTREDSGLWSAYLPGLPLSAEGHTYSEVIDEMIRELRDYATDWQDELFEAPNHRDNWGIVLLVRISSDAQLAEWLGYEL